MKALVPLAWIVGSTSFITLLGWVGFRLIRWAKRGTRAGAVLGLGLGLPAAGINPQPPPKIVIEEATDDARHNKDSEPADPKRPQK